MARIQITPGISLDENELDERFIQSAGPGGQNVNKVATAVQLRFDVVRSPSLPGDLRARLARLSGRKLLKDGILTITARRFRTQERTREDARARLIDMIRRASIVAPARRPTKPKRSVRERRLEMKKKRSALKHSRARPDIDQ